jgi:hypothetical protein
MILVRRRTSTNVRSRRLVLLVRLRCSNGKRRCATRRQAEQRDLRLVRADRVIEDLPVRRPAGFLMPADRWHGDRDELAVAIGRTLEGEERLAQLQADQQHALRSL